MRKLYILLAAVALVVSAAAAVPARAATALQTPPPETVWAFFEALPDADMPNGINSRTLRVEFHKDYEDNMVNPSDFIDEEDDEIMFYGDYLEQITNQVFWSPGFFDPGLDADEVDEGAGYEPEPSLTFSVFPGSDPDRIFGLLEVTEFRPEVGTVLLGEHGYWYSVSKKTVTPTALPLDVPYTDEDITEDGLLYYGQNELYWVMRDRRFTWLEEDDRITLILDGIGAAPVSYVWNGTKFIRDRDYNPLLVYSGGIGKIELGQRVPFDIHGYYGLWSNSADEYVRAWDYVKEGEDESEPRFTIFSYGEGPLTVDAIDIFYPKYKLMEKIHVGMPASEAMEILKENYSYMGEDAPTPYVSDFDGRAWILSGYDDPYMLGVNLKDYKNGKLTPNAKIEVIRIAPAVG